MGTSGAGRMSVVAAVVAAAVVAAARMTAPPAPAGSSEPSIGSVRAGQGRSAASAAPIAASAGVSASTPAAAPATGPEADQMTYAYAATDLAEMARRIQVVGAAVAALGSAADSFSIGALKDAAEAARAEAQGLRIYAEAAHARLAPLSTSDPVLGTAWTRALAAYTRTVAHADAALDLAGYALTLDPAKAAAATESITALGGGESGLLDELATARSGLEEWSARNAAAARAALDRFGAPAA